MKFINNLVEKLNQKSTEVVGVYISPGSFVEVALYNTEYGEIKKYEKTKISYNNVQREINVEEFEAALVYIFGKLEIPAGTPVCLALPNILLGTIQMPSDLESEEIATALSSETEKNYIFKKTEPKVSWVKLGTNKENLQDNLLYSAIQVPQIEKIEEVFLRNKLRLLAIDTSYSVFLRGMSASGIINESIKNEESWALVNISSHNYTITKFKGKFLLSVIETPVALKSIDISQKYQAIGSSLAEKFNNSKLDKIYVISKTEEMTAGGLEDYLKSFAKVYCIDNDKFNNNNLFTYNLNEKNTVSPEVIGAACWKKSDIDINFNFSSINATANKIGPLAQIGVSKPIHLYLLLGIIASALLIGIIKLIALPVESAIKSQYIEQERKYHKLRKLDVPAPKVFDLFDVVYSAYQKNEQIITSFDSIGAVIPEKVWVSSFIIDSQLNTSIKGKAYEIDDIITYYENLLSIGKFKDFKVISIKVLSENIKGENDTEVNIIEDGESIGLPTPPDIENTSTPNSQKYYEFVFGNINAYELSRDNQNNPLLENLPDFAKNILFGN